MNVYLVIYEGMRIGGKAIVVAKNPEDAYKLVMNDSHTVRFNHVEIKLLHSDIDKAVVLYNDNGDY